MRFQPTVHRCASRARSCSLVRTLSPIKTMPPLITFHYTQSPHFRTFYADGVQGGVAPVGRVINLAFFSTRASMPSSVTHTFVTRDGEGGQIGEEVDRKGSDGMQREVEAIATMPLGAAVDMLVWLAGVLRSQGMPVIQTLRERIGDDDPYVPQS